jgi:hypothetical protein
MLFQPRHDRLIGSPLAVHSEVAAECGRDLLLRLLSFLSWLG